jgi:hypothetical protein
MTSPRETADEASAVRSKESARHACVADGLSAGKEADGPLA